MNSLRIGALDVAMVAGYFLLTIALGVWFGRRKIRSADSLFLADREATWPVIGASLFSANISSQQFVGQAGLAYTIGLAVGGFQLVGALCFALLAVFFVDVYLALNLRTAPEFFERRYGPGARMFVSAINIVMILGANIATALYAGATVLIDLVGWASPATFGLAVGAIAAAAGTYTIFGGLRSVLWTDLLQSSLLVVGGAVTFFVSLSAAGGWGEVLATHDPAGRSLWSVVQPWHHPFGWLPLMTGAMILGVHGHCTDHDYVQRALAARSLFHSKMGALFAAFLKVAALFIIAAPGVIAARLLPGLAHPDQAYASLVTHYVPPGLAGLVLAGLLAAILGTVAAGLSASASMVCYDFVLKFCPSLNESARVKLGRWTMIAVLAGCAVLAPQIRAFRGVFAYLVQFWSLLAPPVFVCVVAGVFTRRASRRGATATLVTGTALGAVTFWVLSVPSRVEALPLYFQSALNCGFVITAVCAVVMMLFSSGNRMGSPAGVEYASPAPSLLSMSVRERRVYRATLLCLGIVWLAVVIAFSPWGVVRS
ncbi:MAG: sodium/solute symporter [Opitutaceae bacterium]|nr:sodium/solute symporter [Opitutaceae bacterium]